MVRCALEDVLTRQHSADSQLEALGGRRTNAEFGLRLWSVTDVQLDQRLRTRPIPLAVRPSGSSLTDVARTDR